MCGLKRKRLLQQQRVRKIADCKVINTVFTQAKKIGPDVHIEPYAESLESWFRIHENYDIFLPASSSST